MVVVVVEEEEEARLGRNAPWATFHRRTRRTSWKSHTTRDQESQSRKPRGFSGNDDKMRFGEVVLQ